MANIIVTILEKLKITSPFKNEKADYFLMHDKDSGEVSAVLVDSILAKLNDRVDRIIYPDGFTKTTPIVRTGNQVNISAFDFEWRIQLNPYTNNDDFEQILDPTTSPELKRIDSLAATTEGTIIYYKGDEDEFVIQPPTIPNDQLRLTDLTVFGDEVQEHTEPYVGEVYTLAEKEKLAALNLGTFDLKEDKSNKTSSISGQEASNSYFPSNNGFTSWIKNNLFGWVGSHATEVVDADTMVFSKSGVLGTRTFAQFLANLVTRLAVYYQLIPSSVTNVTTSGSYNLNYNYDTWILTLTGATTFTESNLPAAGKTKVISIYVSGNYSLTYPSGWTSHISGSYSTTKLNQIVVEYLSTGVYWVTITQPA
nr:hypothetical protein [uncultured Flavobacterium sp.]